MLPYKNLLSNMLAGKHFGGFSMPLPTEQMHHLYVLHAGKEIIAVGFANILHRLH
jgi:hypothetical protein